MTWEVKSLVAISQECFFPKKITAAESETEPLATINQEIDDVYRWQFFVTPSGPVEPNQNPTGPKVTGLSPTMK
jgi:hypothetical protein